MRVIIAGSRQIRLNNHDIEAAIEASGFTPNEIVCGGCAGPDTYGKRWAQSWYIPVKHFNADWKAHGPSAGSIRNGLMAMYADALIAFWDGQSRGTADMIEKMRRRGKPVYVVEA